MKKELFICHTSSDKDFVRPLVNRIHRRGISVWYDEYVLGVGDSITKEIDKGLSKCSHGVVIFSPTFFKREWPKQELAGLRTRLCTGESTKILPIYHGVSSDDIRQKYPPLADLFALPSDVGLEYVSTELIETIYPKCITPPLQFHCEEKFNGFEGGLDSINGENVYWQHLKVTNDSDRPIEDLCFETIGPLFSEYENEGSFLQWRFEHHTTKKTLGPYKSADLDICHIRESEDLRIQVISNYKRYFIDIDLEEPIYIWCISRNFTRRMVMRAYLGTGNGFWVNTEWVNPRR